jgi:hypothetical protein
MHTRDKLFIAASFAFAIVVYRFLQKAVQSNQRCHPPSSGLPICNLCYTDNNMQMDSIAETRSTWSGWAEFLRRHGLENLTAFALEAAGPLAVLGAQALYFSGPLLRPALTDAQRDALADLLENRAEALAFAAFLREEISL